MPTVFTHAVVATCLAYTLRKTRMRPVVIAGVLLSMAPDLDVLGLLAGIPYGHSWGHRGMTHSLFFALTAATVTSVTMMRSAFLRPYWWQVWLYLFLCIGSHGQLDMLTNGGMGIALLAPFSDTRYFFPFQPLQVSPLGVGALTHPAMFNVLLAEVIWVWAPSVVLALLLALGFRRRVE